MTERIEELFPAYREPLDTSLPPEWVELLDKLK
jgi:hypothetical protein